MRHKPGHECVSIRKDENYCGGLVEDVVDDVVVVELSVLCFRLCLLFVVVELLVLLVLFVSVL